MKNELATLLNIDISDIDKYIKLEEFPRLDGTIYETYSLNLNDNHKDIFNKYKIMFYNQIKFAASDQERDKLILKRNHLIIISINNS